MSESSDNLADCVTEDDSTVAAAVPVPNTVIMEHDTAAGAGRGDGGECGNTQCGGGRTAGHGEVGRGRGRGGQVAEGGRGGCGGCHKGGRPMGFSNYTTTEINHMLKLVREYLPILGLKRELLAQCHMTFHPDQEQTVD